MVPCYIQVMKLALTSMQEPENKTFTTNVGAAHLGVRFIPAAPLLNARANPTRFCRFPRRLPAGACPRTNSHSFP